MPIVRRREKTRREDDPFVELCLTGHGDMKVEETLRYLALGDPESVPEFREKLAEKHLKAAMSAFVAENPGRRPWAWWAALAPRAGKNPSVDYPSDFYVEERRHVGGPGSAPWDRMFAQPSHWFGIPTQWGGFDPSDPPRFEAEAAYLDRHGLLGAAERKALTPRDFEPVTANPPAWWPHGVHHGDTLPQVWFAIPAREDEPPFVVLPGEPLGLPRAPRVVGGA